MLASEQMEEKIKSLTMEERLELAKKAFPGLFDQEIEEEYPTNPNDKIINTKEELQEELEDYLK